MNKSIFPNLCTAANLAFGVIGISLSATGNFTWAAICVLLSLLADGLDGRIARALGVSGDFGRELDSLADVVGFGVSPAFMLYMMSLDHYGWLGYVPLLVFSVLGAFIMGTDNNSKGMFWRTFCFITFMPHATDHQHKVIQGIKYDNYLYGNHN